jgi:hypothetical protein
MGSPEVGILVGLEYGKWVGLLCFVIALVIGIALHFQAQKNRQIDSE